MAKVIATQTAPTSMNLVRPDFNKDWFEQLVQEKGLDVIHESAVQCPCKVKGTKGNQSTCKNCGGTGWVFINSVKTKMILQSIDLKTNYKEWSMENLGTITITARSVDTLAYMDRISVINSNAIHSQIIYPVLASDGKLFSFLNYFPTEVIDVFVFAGANEKLRRLEKTEYSITSNKITFDDSLKTITDIKVSVRYKCNVQFHVIDLVREIRNSNVIEAGGEKLKNFPLSAIGRRSHYVIDEPNYLGDYIFDNSYIN